MIGIAWWIDGWKDRWVGGYVGEWIGGWKDRWMDGYVG